MSELKNQIEAILFASGKKVSYEELARLCNTDISSVKNEILILKKEYEERNSPIFLTEETDGWKMTVREKYLSLVHKMLPETELSKSVLETLAVIAWKHPVLQSDVIKIRTNKAYEHIDELVERGFISKEKKGRSYLLKVTQKFNEYFELPNKEAIKKIFEDIQKHLKLEETDEKEKKYLGKLEVFEEEEKTEKPKVTIYDHKKEGEEEAEGPEKEAEEAPEETSEEEKEETKKKLSEIEKVKEKIIESEERYEKETEEKAEEESEEKEAPEEEREAEEEKELEEVEEEGRELSPELEEIAKSKNNRK